MLIVCLSCTVIMMIIVSPSLYSTDQSSNVMVWSLFGVTVVMAFIAFKKIIRRCVRWRAEGAGDVYVKRYIVRANPNNIPPKYTDSSWLQAILKLFLPIPP